MNGHTPHEEFLSNIDGRESRWSGSTSNVFFDSYQTYSMQGGDYLDYILPQLDTMLCPIQVAQVNLPDTPQPPLDIWLQNPQTRGASPNSVPSQIRIQVAQHNLPGPPHPLLEIWQQTPPMQVDASPDYISSWIDMSQIQATQENPPQPSQPSFEIPQRTSPAYQASSLDYALSQMDISTPPENQVNQPMSSQPPSEIRNQVCWTL
ncbi:hypothetical protein BJV74DRAFT_548386 [Russula compacta]|nr:hypothetical protein BJV74DRAFT_548386 [Russula compacta]